VVEEEAENHDRIATTCAFCIGPVDNSSLKGENKQRSNNENQENRVNNELCMLAKHGRTMEI